MWGGLNISSIYPPKFVVILACSIVACKIIYGERIHEMDSGLFYVYLKYVFLYTFYWLKRRCRGFLNRKRGI